MNKQSIYASAAVIVAALLVFISIGRVNFYTGWIAFMPLFACVINTPSKKCFRLGLLFGAAFSCFAYAWMITGAQRFTGYHSLYGLGIMLCCTLFVSLYWGSLLFCYSHLQQPLKHAMAILYNGVVTAAVFCLFEFVLSFIAEGLPWFGFYAGGSLTGNLYAIQPAALFGDAVLSFIIIVINYILAAFIIKKQWRQLLIPFAIVIAYMLAGYWIYVDFNSNIDKKQPVKIALIIENILPDIKWDDTNGDALVQRLLLLDDEAAAQRPGIILWSESAIPWTYRKDDDLVNEILKISAASNATHLLGINTAVKDNIVYNSVYCIQPNGNVAGRYDKQSLLSLIEAPLFNINLPFFSSKGFIVNTSSTHNLPLQTAYGKAGILICNESFSAKSGTAAANHDAQFLCNISNDGWFNNTYIVGNHFYKARLRAVETRKDMAVNSNNGYSGFISANGFIIGQRRDVEPFVMHKTVYLNNYKSLAVKYPYLFISTCAIFVLAVNLFKFSKRNN